MKDKLAPFIKAFIPFSIVLFSLHYFVVSYFFSTNEWFLEVTTIYLFHTITTLCFYVFTVYVNQTFYDKTGFSFLVSGFLKMMLSVVFLWPLITADFENKVPDVLSFFIPFFLFLFFETLFSVKLLSNDKK